MGYIKNCIKGIYDISALSELRKESWSKTITFVLVTSIILGSCVVVSQKIQLKDTINVVKKNEAIIPEFVVKDDKLDIEGDSPVVIKEGDTLLIFDENSNDNQSYKDAKNATLWGTTERRVKQDGKELGVAQYKGVNQELLNKSFVINEVKTYEQYPYVSIPMILVVAFMISIMTAVFAKVYYRKTRPDLKLGDIYKVALYSVIVPLLIYTVAYIIGLGDFSVISWVLVLVQFLYIINVINSEKKNVPVKAKK